MFCSDLKSIQRVPSLSVKTRGSMVPPWAVWQMNGVLLAVNGPTGEDPVADPTHCMAGTDPFTKAVK